MTQKSSKDMKMRIRGLSVRDIRFPSSVRIDNYDVKLSSPDHACAYVVIFTDYDTKGFGLTFTVGRGTEIVVQAVKSLSHLVIGQEFDSIVKDFAKFWRRLTNDSQLRWLGPEKGVLHLAASAIVNAIWDLWGRMENKPVWKLLVDMTPEAIVSCIDFSYLEDALTKEEALQILRSKTRGKEAREEAIRANGYPAYTNSGGCMEYSIDKMRSKLQYAMQSGFTRFKVEVGDDLGRDKEKLRFVRKLIGPDRTLLIAANQKWEVPQAISWVKELAEFDPLWVEEPTSPDDVLGYAEIAKALKPLNIGVATGQHCHNRVMFKQLLLAGGVQYCQIDACRLGGVNEAIAVMLMAKKFGVPVCPHASGIGLCEMNQHLAVFNYVCISGDTTNGAMAEWTNNMHDHFMEPAKVKHGCYVIPEAPGFSVEMITQSLLDYEYPLGPTWRELQESKSSKLYEDVLQTIDTHESNRQQKIAKVVGSANKRPSITKGYYDEETPRFLPIRSSVFHDYF